MNANRMKHDAAPRRWLPPALAFVAALALAQSALALDGYHDRRGLYGGVSLNGAGAFGIMDESGAGIGGGLQLGGGVADWITIGLVADIYYFPSETIGKPLVVRPAVQAQLFFPPGLFADLTAGLTYWNYRQGDELPLKDDSDTGFSASAGLGYEFWVAAAQAVFFTAAYDFTWLPDLDEPAHLITAKIGFRWY